MPVLPLKKTQMQTCVRLVSTSEEPHFPNQQEMDDLIRDMGLTKENAQLLTSRLKQWNLLDPTCKASKYRKRHLGFARFFTVSQPHSLCYCSDIFGVFDEIGIDYNPADWSLVYRQFS